MKSKFAFFLLFLGMTVNVHALVIDATCIDDNVEVSDPNQKTFYLESGSEVIITEINENNVTISFEKLTGSAEAKHFKIKYQVGLKIVSDLLESRKYQANIREYVDNDCSASSEVQMFLNNSFGINFADVLRNEVFARHGDSFKNKFYQDLFNQTSWYKVIPGFNVLELNGFEQANIKWLKNLSGSNSQAAALITDGLVAYYPFNGNAKDESGNKYDGKIFNVKLDYDRFNNPNKSYYFNGKTAYILCSNIPNSIFQQGDFTLSAYIKTSTITSGVILQKGCWGASWTGFLFYVNSVWDLDLPNFLNAQIYDKRDHIQLNGKKIVNNGKWHHVALVRSGSNLISYVDGEEDGNIQNVPGVSLANDMLMSIGARYHPNDIAWYFEGNIDDIRVYSRAFSLEEIQLLHREGNAVKTAQPPKGGRTVDNAAASPVALSSGLVAYYPFNGNANDESGNKRHGSVYGAVLTADRFGTTANAYSFNGIDNYIRLAKASDLGITNNSLSISAWFRVETFQEYNHGDQSIIANDIYDHNGGCLHLVIRTGGNFYRRPFFNFYNDGADRYSETKIVPKRWYHIVVSYDAENKLKYIYLNGGLDTKLPGCGTYTGVDYLNVGRYAGGHNSLGNSYFTGIIDDVRIYNRVLSLDEIKALFSENK